MKKEKRGLIDASSTYDTETGEIEKGVLVWVPTRPKSQFGERWFQMAQETLKTLNSRRKEIGFEGMVVFNALLARLDFENFIQVSQTEIAEELDMKTSNVSRAIRRLADLGFIRRGPKVGRSHTFQLHPELAWKGKAKAHHTAREQARKQGWQIIEGGQTVEEVNENQMDLPFDI